MRSKNTVTVNKGRMIMEAFAHALPWGSLNKKTIRDFVDGTSKALSLITILAVATTAVLAFNTCLFV